VAMNKLVTTPITLNSSGTIFPLSILNHDFIFPISFNFSNFINYNANCRQESYFAYLFGVKEPGFYGAIVRSSFQSS
jgi:hypothetical protein